MPRLRRNPTMPAMMREAGMQDSKYPALAGTSACGVANPANTFAFVMDTMKSQATKSPAGAGLQAHPAEAGERSQASLVTSSLVLVDQAAGSKTIQQRLGAGEGFGCSSGVTGIERLDHFLYGGTQHGALGDVAGIAHDGLLGALLGGLDIGHDGNPGLILLRAAVHGAEGTGRWQDCQRSNESGRPQIMADSMAWVNNCALITRRLA
jgi:hypothetical protein